MGKDEEVSKARVAIFAGMLKSMTRNEKLQLIIAIMANDDVIFNVVNFYARRRQLPRSQGLRCHT